MAGTFTTVALPNGCWALTSKRRGDLTRRPSADGYIVMWMDGHAVRAHRYIYERWMGPIPHGLQLDHLCRNRTCVNPGHMEPVTARENQARSPLTSMNKTHCPKGHPYAGENLRVHTSTRGYPNRKCVICLRETKRKTKLRMKERAACPA